MTGLRRRDCFCLTAEEDEQFLGDVPTAGDFLIAQKVTKDAHRNRWFLCISFSGLTEVPAKTARRSMIGLCLLPASLPLRRRKFHIICLRVYAKANSFHCASSPNRTRLRWASVWYPAPLFLRLGGCGLAARPRHPPQQRASAGGVLQSIQGSAGRGGSVAETSCHKGGDSTRGTPW